MLDPKVDQLCNGIEIARSNGLLYEFILCYLQEIELGTEHATAISNALYEWDM